MDGKGTKESDEIKPLNLKILEATSKNVAITNKKGKQYIRQIIYTNQMYFPTKISPIIYFTDKPLIQ